MHNMATATETQFAHLKPEDLSWSARWASIAIRDQLVEIQQDIKALVICYSAVLSILQN